MRALFLAATGLFAFVGMLCLYKVSASLDDPAQVVRFLSLAFACALIAVFWEVTRRRYEATRSLAAEPITLILGLVGVVALVAVGVIFAMTDT